MRELLGFMGEGVVIKPTFRCDYGFTISIGAATFVNYDCVMLDVVDIVIGANCQLGTRVQLITATHPVDPAARRAGWESGAPITIGDNVWLGAGAIVASQALLAANPDGHTLMMVSNAHAIDVRRIHRIGQADVRDAGLGEDLRFREFRATDTRGARLELPAGNQDTLVSFGVRSQPHAGAGCERLHCRDVGLKLCAIDGNERRGETGQRRHADIIAEVRGQRSEVKGGFFSSAPLKFPARRNGILSNPAQTVSAPALRTAG